MVPKLERLLLKSGLHYGWYVVLAGLLCIFAGIGFGRFALGMLLPAMGETLGLSYAQMGMISTFNFVGYLLAVVASGPLAARVGTRRLIFWALLLVGGSMLLMSRAQHFYAALGFYMLTGVGSGASNVPMMALVSAWFVSSKRGRAAGFIVIGSGFAILMAGRLVPLINERVGAQGWRLSWLALGVMVLAVALVCRAVLRDRPAELGLQPVGSQPAGPQAFPASPSVRKADLLHLGAIYFLFGYTYVIYATFLVTALIQERGFSEAAAGRLWSWVGLLSLLSGPVFGTLSDLAGRKTALVLVFAIQSLAYLLVALPLPTVFLYLSIGCYGVVAWSIPSIMAALVGDYAGPQHAGRVFGVITFIFGWGQISGPAVAGYLAEKTAGFAGSFLMAAFLATVAAVLSGLLRKPAAA